jgi:protein-tyrosine phosphatase
MKTYRIKGPWLGELAIIPRPRGGDWLHDEMRTLKDEGFDTILSLLTPEEIEELDLTQAPEFAKAEGLQFCNYPIPDLGVPASRDSARQLIERLHQNLLEGKKIAVHCRGSIGRSGLIASSLLVLSGIEPARAFREVSDVRGFDAPETQEQRDWVAMLSRELTESVV